MAAPTDQDAVVFLDVDGVLGARVSVGDEVSVSVPPRMRPLVQRLSSIAEVVWATSWGFEESWAAGTRLPLDLVAIDAFALLTARDVADVERAVTTRSTSRSR